MTTSQPPSADVVFDTLFAYQRSAALKAALDLDLFSVIDDGANTAAAAATRCGASERGIRILCDYLTTLDLLEKSGSTYQLPPTSAAFLSQRSPMYMGSTARFLLLPEVKDNFDDLTGAVRRGGVAPAGNTVAPENPIWVEFARAMVPMMVPAAHGIADALRIESAGPARVLDIAASHGIFGITLAVRNPEVEVTAVDWASVLEVAKENAAGQGVSERIHMKPGDAFEVEFGAGYDVALITNFLHHFDHPTCISFLAKVRRALKTGGRVVILEMVPNPDRVTPVVAARFSLTMLGGTPAGDAYTLDELRDQLEKAGFADVSSHPLPTPETVVVARADLGGRLSDRDQVAKRPDEDHPAGYRGRGHDHFAHRVCREQLERGSGLDHEDLAVLARKVNPPVSGDRRGAEAGPSMLEPLEILARAGPRVITPDDSADVNGVNIVAVDNRCRGHRSAAGRAPGHEVVASPRPA